MKNLATELARIGAPIAASLLRSYGGKGGEAAGWLIEQLANSIGVEPDPEKIATEIRNNPTSAETIVATEQARGAEWVGVFQAGLANQAAVFAAESRRGGLASAWRPGWMYFLGFLWAWALVLVPLVNAWLGSAIPGIDLGILLTLTSWFIALYMGGHTVKELGKNALDAVRAMKEG